ncbi:MAG: hypothetical protein ABIQ18_13240, partial [Umezawaea sp.]
MPRPGSGAERMLVVPLARDDVDTDQLFPLDLPESRHARALLMASFIQWLAHDLTRRRQGYLQRVEEYADTLTDEGETVRQAAALANTYVGWEAVTEFLVEVAAITDVERDRLLSRIQDALQEAGRAAVDPDLPTRTGARVRELLAYALRTGLVHVSDVRTGDCPPWPLAARLGWRRTATDIDSHGMPVRSRVDRQGQQLGYVLHDPGPKDRGAVLMLESTALEAALKAASGTQAEQFQIDRNTACRALYDEGVLIADACEQAKGKLRFTVKSVIHCENRTGRMVSLWLDRILGDDPDDDTDPAQPDPTTPPANPPTNAAPDQPVNELTPWFDPDPQAVDGSQRGVVASAPASQEEPATMPEESFISRPHTDRDGVVGWTEEPGETGPCVLCGVRCRVVISGNRVHLLCWERSNAPQRAVRQAQTTTVAASQPLHRPAVTPPAAPAHTAPAHTAPAHTAPTTPPAIAAPAPANASAAVESRRPAATTAGGQFLGAAAVVDVDGIWCSNGERVDLPDELRHVGDLVQLAERLNLGTQVTKYRDVGGQLWVGERLLRTWGMDVD